MRRLARSLVVVLLVALGPLAAFGRADTVTRQVGRVTIRADLDLAFPGGLLLVQVQSRYGLGAASAHLDGVRCPFFPAPGGLRALVPVPPTAAPGPATLGIEISARGGRQRIAVPVAIAARQYPERTVEVPEAKRELAQEPGAVRDGREIQLLLRTITSSPHWSGSFRPPVPGDPVYSYGAPTRYVGIPALESTLDAIYGEYHRGLDYEVAAGTPVLAPAAGTVLLAAHRPLTGQTLVLDHGQGVISVFFHLSRVEVPEGQWVEAGTPVAASGDSGLTAAPHLHWAVYVHGVAVDPRVMEQVAEGGLRLANHPSPSPAPRHTSGAGN